MDVGGEAAEAGLVAHEAVDVDAEESSTAVLGVGVGWGEGLGRGGARVLGGPAVIKHYVRRIGGDTVVGGWRLFVGCTRGDTCGLARWEGWWWWASYGPWFGVHGD